jgi:hypothetical protein
MITITTIIIPTTRVPEYPVDGEYDVDAVRVLVVYWVFNRFMLFAID